MVLKDPPFFLTSIFRCLPWVKTAIQKWNSTQTFHFFPFNLGSILSLFVDFVVSEIKVANAVT